jgi:feruloyl esterase
MDLPYRLQAENMTRKGKVMPDLRRTAAVLGTLLGVSTAFAKNSGTAMTCTKLSDARISQDTTITTARMIGADASTDTPAYCEVTGSITPAPESHITVVYRLPAAWNGKLVGLGGGGWAGNITLARPPGRKLTAAASLAKNYATAQTDGGHVSTEVWNTSWAANPASVTDFSYRAIHLMTVVGKAVVARYYGHPQTKAYFQGCSTGGRQGLMEVQRFPDDYDGVVAGAPVYDLLTQTSVLVRNQAFAAPGAHLNASQISRLHEAALAACDTQDGVQDGIVSDPRSCNFDPAILQCKEGASTPDCLSAPQVAAVREMYAGVKTADGRIASYPLSRGSEGSWSRFSASPTGPANAGLGGLRTALFGDPDYDVKTFAVERDLSKVRDSEFAALYEAKNPDITPFIAHGGKLLLWHGFDDPGPSPLGTIAYYEAVQRTTGAKTNALNSSTRLYLLPGVYHCGDGPGADEFDSLTALDQWVESGQPPESLIATRNDGKLSRPLCAYPTLPRYKGSGDPAEAGSFECR